MPVKKVTPSPIDRRLGRLVALARAAYGWEMLWRAAIPPLIVVSLFFCVSWLGVWLELPHKARLAGVGLFALAFLASLFGLRHFRILSRHEALKRIDRASGVDHRPASVLEDRLANQGHDPATAALWALHRKRAEAELHRLSPGAPSPRIVDLDRYALRAAALLLLVGCAFIAGSERYARTIAAFDWNLTRSDGPGYRIDAWIDPPPYTGRAPILLDLGNPAAHSDKHPLKIEAPAGSTVIIRASGGHSGIETAGLLVPPPPPKDEAKPADKAKDQTKAAKAPESLTKDAKTLIASSADTVLPPGDIEQKFVLRGDGKLVLRHDGEVRGAFDLRAIADKPPVIMLREVPKANARGTLTLAYTVGDDYGVSKAEVEFSNPKINGVPALGPSLVDPPVVSLSVPSTQNGIGDGESTIDLSDHPWAGTRVTMVLVAHDEGGNEGRSDPVEITLPQKPFINPLARALVEQRRNLVLEPRNKARVEAALDALMIAPEAFQTPASAFLGLNFARHAVGSANTKEELIAAADFLWAMALQIENGDLSDAEKALRAAEKELRDAIDRKAPEEEIKKLTENLQAAMDKFLSELAQKQERDDKEQAQSQSGPSKTISRKDLQALIDKLREASRSGNKQEAQRALEQLQDLLENLKTAKRQKPDPKQRAMAQALNELDQMTRDQQDLRDETYKDGQGNDQPNPPRQNNNRRAQKGQGQQSGQNQDNDQDQGDQSAQDQNGQDQNGQGRSPSDKSADLKKRQQELHDRLEAVQKRLKQAGQGQDSLDEAGKSMKDAEESLSQGQDGRGEAVDEQGKALDNLRKGAKKLADAMQQGEGEQNGQQGQNGEGQNQGSQDGQQVGDADPLGRPRGGNPFNSNSKFDPLGVPAAQRAQRVLEELRRRLADPTRPQDETDYLERLLKPY